MHDTQSSCFSLLTLFGRKRPPASQPSLGSRKLFGSKNPNEESDIKHNGIPCVCNLSADSSKIWDHIPPPGYTDQDSTSDIYKPEVLKTIEDEINKLDSELRTLSLQIHDHPELMFQEKFAHDTLTTFMASHGFSVTKHYLNLETAWKATFSHGTGGRVIGVNSEMNALPAIGHACGHNLVAIIGVGVSLAIKAALEKHNIAGKIVLLGTPAEEGGGGKIILINRGGYGGMDACVMAHPSPGPAQTGGTGPSKAVQSIEVEYFGQTAHASAAPWEGKNALDAAFIAYSSISVLRQQMKPTHRVHGVVQGKNWVSNIIPDYAKMKWDVRAPSKKETEALRDRVVKCLKAAAVASDTKVKITLGTLHLNLSQNETLAQAFTQAASKFNVQVSPDIPGNIGSTDFGNVTHELPALHASYSIPTKPNGGNHTPLFAAAARTMEAHKATLVIAKALAHTGFRVLDDEEFFKKVNAAYKKNKTGK